jgi:hypothetical protein
MSDDLHDRHTVDQALAEALELGSIRVAGKGPDGDDLLELTAKGTLSTALLLIQPIIERADSEKRDLTEDEKGDVREHLETVLKKL